jgi:hypothetical protein
MRTRNRLLAIVYWALAVSASSIAASPCSIAVYVSQAIEPNATTRIMMPMAARFSTHRNVIGLMICGAKCGAVCAGDCNEVAANAVAGWFTLDIQVPQDRH